ncbi:MAG: patatin-like phospholipase family protein [Acetobacteraceae bacterium]
MTEGPHETRRVKLALQGGGAHGAFTWGVLDRLLEDRRIEVEALCGTSAGAVNAALVAHGLAEGGGEAARATLRRFWEEIGRLASLTPLQPCWLDLLVSPGNMTYSPAWRLADLMTRQVSPYELNPTNANPLRDLLEGLVDFARLRAGDGPPLFVCATNVLTGRLRVFERREMTADRVMASACLPMLFQAVEVEGEFFWDGGYSGNPPIFPLIYMGGGPDVLIVQLNPINIPAVPTAIADIIDRVNTLSFNASLMREMRMIRFVTDLIDRGELPRERHLRLFIHTIAAEEELARLNASSKLNATPRFLGYLFALGRARAEAFLAAHFGDLGVRSSTDIDRVFL